ncbi:MAG: alpha/beta fold hydrolase [Pseudomonadota bacterium]
MNEAIGVNAASKPDIVGAGEPLLLLHGWPFHKAAFRKLAPLLAERYLCHSLNSLGMNDTEITIDHDLSFHGHADRLIEYIDRQGWQEVSILAHDTAGTFARIMAANAPDRVKALFLLNTEIPHHRPPFIPLYRRLSHLPFFEFSMKHLMRSAAFQRSPAGFGECFYDRSMIDRDFVSLFGDYWFQRPKRFSALIKYLQEIDFTVVDNLGDIHGKISAPLYFIWGAEDKTFPADLGYEMAKAAPSFERFVPIEKTCFLPHEERPMAVAEAILSF